MATFEVRCPRCKGPVVKQPSGQNWCPTCKRTYCGQPMEVYSRVVGYFRPVSNWNKGKQGEFKERREYQPIADDGKLKPARPRQEKAPTGGRWVNA